MNFKQAMEIAGQGVDVTGVCVVIVGLLIASALFLSRLRQGALQLAYKQYRQSIGRAILLGLEFLVAGDIIRTVAVDPTLQSVVVLGIIVLIRTFLSMALELELEGRWPWQQKPLQVPQSPLEK